MAIVSLQLPIAAATAVDACGASSDLGEAQVGCEYTGPQLVTAAAANSAGTGVRYQVRLKCLSQNPDGVCANPSTCVVPRGSLRYDVLRSEAGGPFVKVGEVCLTPDEVAQLGISTAVVLREFRRLSWPTSPLVVQPPGGRTLVNFETNFSTTNTEPSTRTVVLLGQQVEIEATPTSWIWHFGDGESKTTRTPGALYPDLEVTHTYLDADVVETPSVDTVYTGRYRINGGPWQQIPETLTVPGEAVELEVVEAEPVLVGAD